MAVESTESKALSQSTLGYHIREKRTEPAVQEKEVRTAYKALNNSMEARPFVS